MTEPDDARSVRGDAVPPDDGELIAACLRGDDDAWAALIERYERLVYSIPRRAGLDQNAAEEIFQEVFAALVAALPRLHRRTALPKWLMTVAHRSTVRWKRRQRHAEASERAEASDDPPPLATLVRWEQQDLVHRALEQLDPPCRALLDALFRDPERPGYDQIAARLGIPVGSIGPSRARCLRKLLTRLEAIGGVIGENERPDDPSNRT